jgi:cobalt/nickel transport system permease protein
MIAFAPNLLGHADSPLARLDPRWKLVAFTVAAVAVALLQTVACSAVALVAVLSLAPASGLTLRALGTRLAGVIAVVFFFAIWLPFFLPPNGGGASSIGPLQISGRGVQLAVLICLKTTAILTLVIVLLATAPVNVYLSAASFLHVPARLLHVGMLAYRYLFVLMGEFGALRVAVRLRAYRNRMSVHSYRTIGHLAGALLVRSSDRAERVARAMQCRGYDGRFHSMSVFRTRAADVLFFACVLTAGAGVLAWDCARRF